MSRDAESGGSLSLANESGADFERQVANAYRLLGFEVEHNISLGGFQIDLVARRAVPGVGDIGLLIECKYVQDGSVSNEDVRKLSGLFRDLAQQKGFHRAVMVTNGEFSQYARSFAAENPHLALRTLKELEDETLDSYAAYGRFLRDYRDRAIYQIYVPLGAEGALPGEVLDRSIADVEEAIVEWIEGGASGFLTILADFGAGKTTLLERLKFQFCDRYEKRRSTIKPVLFRAKDYHRQPSFTDFVTATFLSEFGVSLPPSTIMRLIEEGHFLILIDGFDEVALNADEQARRNLFLQFSRLFNTPSHSILTCRPAYFLDWSELDALVREALPGAEQRSCLPRSLPDQVHRQRVARFAEQLLSAWEPGARIRRVRGLKAGALRLNTFTGTQIDVYLRNRNEEFEKEIGLDWKAVKALLAGIYDLDELMHRPILLNMIVTSVLTGAITLGTSSRRFSAADIYEAYIDSLLQREERDRESRRLLRPELRQELLERIALALLRSEVLHIRLADVVAVVAGHRSRASPGWAGVEPLSSEDVARDIVLTGFLTLEEDGVLRFAHRSFLEYLIARFCRNEILAQGNDPILGEPLPAEVIYFLSGYIVSDPEFRGAALERLARWRGSEPTGGSPAALGEAVLASTTTHHALELHDLAVSVPASTKVFEDCLFEGLGLSCDGAVSWSFVRSTVQAKLRCASGSLEFSERSELECSAEGFGTISVRDCVGRLSLGETLVSVTLEGATLDLDGRSAQTLACERAQLRIVANRFATGSLELRDSSFVQERGWLQFTRVDARASTLRLANNPMLVGAGASHEREAGHISMHDCSLLVLPFGDGPVLRTAELARTRLTDCRIAGLGIDAEALDSGLPGILEGLLLVHGWGKEGLPLRRIGNLLCLNNDLAVQDRDGAIRLLEQTRRQARSEWLGAWLASAVEAADQRIGVTAGPPARSIPRGPPEPE